MTSLISMPLIFFVLGTIAVGKFIIDYSNGTAKMNFSVLTCIGVTVISFLLACLI